MNCPFCKHPDHLEIDLHADGYSSDLMECSHCGALLKARRETIETVFGPDRSFYSHDVFATQS